MQARTLGALLLSLALEHPALAQESIIQELTTENLATIFRSDKPSIIEIGASWCAPCQAMEPHLERIAQAYEDELKVVKITSDENPTYDTLSGLLSLDETPVLPTLIFRSGESQTKESGYKEFLEINDAIGEHLNVHVEERELKARLTRIFLREQGLPEGQIYDERFDLESVVNLIENNVPPARANVQDKKYNGFDIPWIEKVQLPEQEAAIYDARFHGVGIAYLWVEGIHGEEANSYDDPRYEDWSGLARTDMVIQYKHAGLSGEEVKEYDGRYTNYVMLLLAEAGLRPREANAFNACYTYFDVLRFSSEGISPKKANRMRKTEEEKE